MGNQLAYDGRKKLFKKSFCNFALIEKVKLTRFIHNWLVIKTCPFTSSVVSYSKKELQEEKMPENTTKFTSDRYNVGTLLS